MASPRRVFFLLVIGTFTLLPGAGGLHCYACEASAAGSTCESDMEALLQAKGENNPRMTKNCDIEDKNQYFCSIETSEGGGLLRSIIRDCSDGVTFSFSSKRLSNITATNQTTCAAQGDKILCITLCRGNYCNGPQLSGLGTLPRPNSVFWILAAFLLLAEFSPLSWSPFAQAVK